MTEVNATPALSVFVTGATTGLGRAITRQLAAQGCKVAGTAESLSDAQIIREDGGLPVYLDLMRASEIASNLKMAKVDVIVHAAPQVINTLPFHKPDWAYYRGLLDSGGAALASAAAQSGVKLIVHLSFAALYAGSHGEWADENAAINTESQLLAAAAQAEEALLHGAVPACVLRAGFNYGPGSQSVRALYHALISRGTVMVGHHPVSWVHNADLASAVARTVSQQPAGEIFNVADDNPVSPAAFVDQFADNMGVSRPGKGGLPFGLAMLTGSADERALMDAAFKVSSAKAKEKLGWSLQFPTIKSGIEQTLLAWRAAEPV